MFSKTNKCNIFFFFITFVSMKTLINTIFFLLLFVTNIDAQSKRALIIGIGEYPQESGWGEINGDKDVEIVSKMLAHLDYKAENICKLINHEATKQKIVSQLKSLAEVSSKGDIIYIHFSGHGQRVTDLNGDDPIDKLDEAIIPYDAQKQYKKGVYEGENHIIDDELNIYLSQIADKIEESGKLIVTLDACHSGDATRCDDIDLPNRGIFTNFEIPIDNPTPTTNVQTLIRWIEISACKNYQANFECRIGNELYGSLTYALYDIVTKSKNSTICVAVLSEKIATLHNPYDIPQTPTITTHNKAKSIHLF